MSLVCTHVSDSPCGICVHRLEAALLELPEGAATQSRDYGRGYAQAIKDVLVLANESLAVGDHARTSLSVTATNDASTASPTATDTPSALREKTK